MSLRLVTCSRMVTKTERVVRMDTIGLPETTLESHRQMGTIKRPLEETEGKASPEEYAK